MQLVGWVLVAIVGAGGAKAARPAQPARPAMPAVARYEAALAKARAQKSVNVEELYGLALGAGAEVLRDLVKVTEAQYAGKEAKPAVTAVQGLTLSWQNVLYAEPQPRFFAALAKEKGRSVDEAFFERLAATKPEGTWPVYIEQQTDVSGCVRYEAPVVAPVYRGWLEFKKRFPKAYPRAVAQELERAEHALAGTCACGRQADVEAGLDALAKALAGTKAGTIAKQQLDRLRAGKSELRLECRATG
ncbi:MAG TPA: hypothetical protein VEB43_16630 [Anaeromyxobacter sp.]|nr:hypothetical protein [Anaeromyxobacter sp.]